MKYSNILSIKITGTFKVDDGVKIHAENYCKFLDITLFQCYKSETRNFKENNVPSYSAKLAIVHFRQRGFKDINGMAPSPSRY